MRIIVDIAHPAHVNFFKNALQTLSEQGHEIIITGLRRGKLPRILEQELSQYPIEYVGRHRGTKWSIIVEANILKFFRLFWLVWRQRGDFGLSVGSFTLGASLKILGKPNVQFDDDPERTMNVRLEKWTSTRLFFPPVIAPHENVVTMNALKEWAYLSPRYFTPSQAILEQYDLRAHGYIFVREVSSGSLNYTDQASGTIASFADQFPKDYPVVLSLEDKHTRASYPADWILLQEPVSDIHSLLYYSRLIVSSGDSMAREGAMLGVPSMYVGIREMKANALMIQEGMLFKRLPQNAPAWIKQIINREVKVSDQTVFRDKLMAQWDDITEFIVQQVRLLGS